ncbi:MAG: tRNA (adenosine(37)-N6)-threonylcarbamoyltransferase complex ATPase subunit type 1 TsaE [Candidatus Omnitrophota bacterium]
MKRMTTYSAKDTAVLGAKFARMLKERDVVILEGVLGGGKTTFIRGILAGLGCRSRVLSPSFTLLRHYKKNKIHICHADLYRIKAKDIIGLGLEDYLYSPSTITFIEWGEKIERYLPRCIKIRFSFLSEARRAIVFSIKGYPRRRLTI